MFERPEGIKIASLFILGDRHHLAGLAHAAVDRAARHGFEPDELATQFIEAADRERTIRIIANRPGDGDPRSTRTSCGRRGDSHHLPPDDPVLFLEVQPGDASEFSDVLKVQGVQRRPYRVLRCKSPAIPNAIAALLLHIRDQTGQIPHVYFGWTEGNPITYLMKFLAFGEGDTAPVTREVLRQSEPDPLTASARARRVTRVGRRTGRLIAAAERRSDEETIPARARSDGSGGHGRDRPSRSMRSPSTPPRAGPPAPLRAGPIKVSRPTTSVR